MNIGKRYIENNINVDLNLIEIGSILHDIGRSKSNKINHAIIGVQILKKYNIDYKILNIIKKHIGCGIDENEAIKYDLPLDNYIPLTDEEKIVAHSDNLINGIKKIDINTRINILKKKKIYNETIYNRYMSLDKEIKKKAKL